MSRFNKRNARYLHLQRRGGVDARDVDAFLVRVEEQRRLIEREFGVSVRALWETPYVPEHRQETVSVRFELEAEDMTGIRARGRRYDRHGPHSREQRGHVSSLLSAPTVTSPIPRSTALRTCTAYSLAESLQGLARPCVSPWQRLPHLRPTL